MVRTVGIGGDVLACLQTVEGFELQFGDRKVDQAQDRRGEAVVRVPQVRDAAEPYRSKITRQVARPKR